MIVYKTARTYVMQLVQKKIVVTIKSRKVDKTTFCLDNKESLYAKNVVSRNKKIDVY